MEFKFTTTPEQDAVLQSLVDQKIIWPMSKTIEDLFNNALNNLLDRAVEQQKQTLIEQLKDMDVPTLQNLVDTQEVQSTKLVQ